MPHQAFSLPLVPSAHQPMHLMAFVASALDVLSDTALQHWMDDLSVLVDNRGNWTTNNLLDLLREGRELMSQRFFLGQLHFDPCTWKRRWGPITMPLERPLAMVRAQ